MPQPTAAEAEQRLAEIGNGLADARADFGRLVRRSRELMRSGKAMRDEGLIAKLRRQLGLD